MSKYEIMLMLDPKQDVEVVSSLIKDVFAKPAAKIEKLPFSELAYEINKSTTAQYVLVHVDANGDEIKEFRRKANILKTIWRHLVINLDTEKGLVKKPKSKYAKWAEAREQQRREAAEAKRREFLAQRAERAEQRSSRQAAESTNSETKTTEK